MDKDVIAREENTECAARGMPYRGSMCGYVQSGDMSKCRAPIDFECPQKIKANKLYATLPEQE